MQPKLTVKMVPTDELVPYAGNAKEHPYWQIEQIAASIEQFGFDDPVGIWHNPEGQPVIVEGHGRVLAAKELGIEQVPTIALDHLDDEARRAYTLAHNKLTTNTGYDADMLAAELDAIDGIDMAAFGFGDDDLERIERENDGPVMVDEDEPSEQEPIESRVKLGETWQLGEHRLMCGSSTDPSDVARLMDGVKDAFLFTSPPYADMRDYNGDKDVSVPNLAQFIGAYAPYCEFQAVNLGIKRTSSEIVTYWDDYISAAHDTGLKLMAWNVWDKGMCGSVGQQMALVPIRHEFVFMFAQHDFTFVFGSHEKALNRTWEKKPENVYEGGVKPRTRRNVDGTMRVQTSGNGDASNPYKEMESVIRITPEMDNKVRQKHPAPFPVQLPAEYIAAFTPKQGGIVADPFCGSGTTIVACEQLGRSCRAMELDPIYCEVAIQRWEALTGETAQRII